MDAPKNVQPNRRKQVVIALTPLMTVLAVLLVNMGDKTGPYHGKVRLAAFAGVFLGAVIVMISMLRAIKRPSKA